jgi:hypothetical protein
MAVFSVSDGSIESHVPGTFEGRLIAVPLKTAVSGSPRN